MPTPPSTENYYTGGHKVILGGIDLGNIDDISITPEATILDHWSRRTGTRVLDRQVAIAKRFTIAATLDEHAKETYQFYFLGLPIGNTIPVLRDPLRETSVYVEYVREGGVIWTYSHTRAVTRPAAAMAFGDGTDWAKFGIEIEALQDLNETYTMGRLIFAS